MGHATSGPGLSFNPQLRVEFRGATVNSDAGLLLPRELDEGLGLSTLIDRHLTDPRTGHNRQFPLPDLLRQSIYSRLAGYEDTNNAERLAEDPAFRMLASRERRQTSVALTSTLHWFETDVLAEEPNYHGLAHLNTELVQRAATRSPIRRVILDIDSSESPVHGAQEQSAYNGHFESVCYPGRRSLLQNQRGTAEQWIKEGKAATHWTRLSCHRFWANEVRLLLGVIAYNLGNLLRRLVLPLAIQSWSLTSLQQRLFKTGGRLIRHARSFILQTGREPLDAEPPSADPPAHRATRAASDVIERTAPGGSEKRATPAGMSLRWVVAGANLRNIRRPVARATRERPV